MELEKKSQASIPVSYLKEKSGTGQRTTAFGVLGSIPNPVNLSTATSAPPLPSAPARRSIRPARFSANQIPGASLLQSRPTHKPFLSYRRARLPLPHTHSARAGSLQAQSSHSTPCTCRLQPQCRLSGRSPAALPVSPASSASAAGPPPPPRSRRRRTSPLGPSSARPPCPMPPRSSGAVSSARRSSYPRRCSLRCSPPGGTRCSRPPQPPSPQGQLVTTMLPALPLRV
jgi:hypothetical protein